ncbi:MAG: methyl-accepting chemotaxis protein [Pseudomonadota bacterium]
MTVRLAFTLIVALLACAAVGKFAYTAVGAHREYRETEFIQTLSRGVTEAMNATVAMSLERSVVQVALAFAEPIPPAFREIVSDQRAKANEGMSQALSTLGPLERLRTRELFRRDLGHHLNRVDAIRREVDALLARPLASRDAERAYELPFELKAEIEALRTVIELLRADTVAGSPVAETLRFIQGAAWEGREYGGRARTYYAIATLNQEKLKPEDTVVRNMDRARADVAWRAITNAARSFNLSEELVRLMGAVRKDYFETYVPVVERLHAASEAAPEDGTPSYDIKFEAFFALSNTGLDAFANLSNSAGHALNDYWGARTATAYRVVLESVVLGLIVATLALVATLFVWTAVAGRLREVTEALARVADGDLTPTVAAARTDLDEISSLVATVRQFRETAGRQIAMREAVDASNTPMLILDGARCVIARNRAWDALLASFADRTDGLYTLVDGREDYAPLVEKVLAAQSSEAGRTNAAGVTAYEISHADKIMQAKMTRLINLTGDPEALALEVEDVTLIRVLENEVVAVVSSVEQGRFDKRVSMIDDLGFTSFIARGLNTQIEAVATFMSALDTSVKAMARGDLTASMAGNFVGDYRVAQEGFNASIKRLGATLVDVGDAADHVRTEATTIAAGARDLAQRAEDQSSTLLQTAATMELMDGSIRENTDTADALVSLSRQTSERAEVSGKVVTGAVEAISRIQTSASKIADIIGVIDSIAFQTNLLALNAAVEAARAGAAGKGFEVVASEVRTLAQRSSEAARDIRELITASAEHVSEGVRSVNETGEGLSALVASVREVADRLEGVSQMQRDQVTRVAEVASAVQRLETLTKGNAAVADQSAGAANNLTHASESLFEGLARFKVASSEPVTLSRAG